MKLMAAYWTEEANNETKSPFDITLKRKIDVRSFKIYLPHINHCTLTTDIRCQRSKDKCANYGSKAAYFF